MAIVVVVQIGLWLPCDARGGSFTTVYVGSTSTTVDGLNDHGVSVGSFSNNGFSSNAFVRDTGGAITAFDVPGSTSTYGMGIDNGGLVVGYYLSGSDVHSYVRSTDGTFSIYDVPGSTSTWGNAINDQGQIAGTYQLGNTLDYHGFVRAADGTLTTFDVPGASWTFAQGISNSGQVVGYYFDGFGFHAFTRAADGTFTKFDVPGSLSSYAWGVNDSGQIVGYSIINSYFTSSGFVFIYSGYVRDPGGTITTFDVPGSASTVGQGINNEGQLVGNYTVGSITYGFITTVPEPSSLSLLIAGILGLVIIEGRRSRTRFSSLRAIRSIQTVRARE